MKVTLHRLKQYVELNWLHLKAASSGLVLAGVLANSVCVLSAADKPRAEHVFIISFDQGNPDLIRRSPMPTFQGMAAEGARTWNAYTVVPSLTLPAHTSMLTGVGVQAHQTLWNNYDPQKGRVNVPTVFGLAKQLGLVTAMFVGKEKFEHLNVPGTVDTYVQPGTDDARTIAKVFAEQVGTFKPNLCFIHFRDPDTIGHKHGANSPEKVQALIECDAALKTIKDAIQTAGLTNSVIILTADHGSHDVKDREGKIVGTHGSAETDDVKIPWVVWGKGVKTNFTIATPVVLYDTAATALWLLDVPLPEHFWGRPVMSAFESTSPTK